MISIKTATFPQIKNVETGQDMPMAAVEAWIRKYEAEHTALVFGDETQNPYKSKLLLRIENELTAAEKIKVNSIRQLMSDAMKATADGNLLNLLADEVDDKLVYTNISNLSSGGHGKFIEKDILGIDAGSIPTADIGGEVNAEVKAHLSGNKITVGTITIAGIEIKETDTDEQIKAMLYASVYRKQLMLYKLYTKMRNLLYFRLKDLGSSGTSRRVSFELIILYMELIVKKVQEFLEKGQHIAAKATSIKKGSLNRYKVGDKWYVKRTYEISIQQSASTERFWIIDNIVKLAEMYERKIDFLNIIQNDAITRNEFFKDLRDRTTGFMDLEN